MITISLPLTTDRLVLRDITHEDTFAFSKIISHPRLLRKTVIKGEEKTISTYTSFQDGIDAFINMSIATQHKNPRTIYSLAITDKKTKKAIGSIELYENDLGDTEFGCCLHPDFQDQGYAYEASHALCSQAFQHGIQTITATTRSDNKASKKLLQKLGMTLIGYKPTAFQDGMPTREYWMVERIPFLVAQNTVKQKTTAEAVA